ncbi:MAG: phosphatidylglycerol lysyltransferase domain-containing protein [Mariniphaga sp.]
MLLTKVKRPFYFIGQFIKQQSLPFIRENSKILAQAIFTIFSIGIGIWFINHEQTELADVNRVLLNADWRLVIAGIILTATYILLQGLMYIASFATIRHRISLISAVILFLKRNLISIFLPAGGISSLAFFTGEIEQKGITKSQIHFASTIYGFVGILSVIVVAVPIFVYSLLTGGLGSGEWIAFFSALALILIIYLIYRSIIQKGLFYRWLVKSFSFFEVFSIEIRNNRINKKQFFITVLYSIMIEFVGIAHLYVSMLALHFNPSLFAAFIGYIISVIFLIISPFLRGLGAIEVSMTFVLIRLGYPNMEAVTITLLYRFFEFWLPLVAGIFSFLLKINKLLMRIIPALLLFSLGIINIISVLTPAISERIHWLSDFLPLDAIIVSNYFVLGLGLFLLVTASFMLKGLKIAWWFAFFLSFVSMIGNLTKAVDYEEAIAAFLVMVVLILTKKDYYVKNNPRLRTVGIQTAVLSMLAVLIYSVVGFYYLDKKHFNIDFSFLQSLRYALQNYFLVGSSDLIPADKFAYKFILSINVSGFLTLGFLIYTLIRPYFLRIFPSALELERPRSLVDRYGNSALDYFKTYHDKMIFEPEGLNAFIAFRPAGNFAVALENPVAEDESQMKQCIRQFNRFCFDNGLKSIYYRVSESDLPVYKSLKKKVMFLGQEGLVDLNLFSLEGGAKKSIRNALSKVKERGYRTNIHTPPIKDGLLQKIKAVSNEWLEDNCRSEIIFSQGMFVWTELKQQTLITVENSEEKIVAFLNIIPDFANGEGTCDLIRKTSDAPNGVMDFLMVELFRYLKSEGYSFVNIGFAPMSGIDDPHTFKEKSMKFAYEKIRGFSQYKGLREYKEKFATVWINKYLVYDHDYDLIQIPGALMKVIKP